MTTYLLGIATIPTAAALIYATWRLWQWLLDNRIIAVIVGRITGRMMPQKLYDRAIFAVRVALCSRIWGIDLPGKISILVTVGRTATTPGLHLRAAGVLTDELTATEPTSA
jgi:hypothetical protein